MSAPVPALPRGCGSWIVTSPGGRVFELNKRANVQKAADAGWQVETAIGYLARVNTLTREQLAQGDEAGVRA